MNKILVDADACPVVGIIENEARKRKIPVMLLCDTSHVLKSDYSDVKIIGSGADAVDFALINNCKPGDVVISQDYGVAAMALGKKAYCMHQSGKLYTNDNIDQLLAERYTAQKIRRSSKKIHLKGPKKRTKADDENFKKAFIELIEERLLK